MSNTDNPVEKMYKNADGIFDIMFSLNKLMKSWVNNGYFHEEINEIIKITERGLLRYQIKPPE